MSSGSLFRLFPAASIMRSLFPVDCRWTSSSNLVRHVKVTLRGFWSRIADNGSMGGPYVHAALGCLE